jgi:hypothetical protein
VTDRPYAHIGDNDLTEEWVSAFKDMAKDYKRAGALTVVDALGDEIRVRGIARPIERVAAELAEMAAQMRAASAGPVPARRIEMDLDEDLMTFVAKRNVASK